jgi:hypothetical protein
MSDQLPTRLRKSTHGQELPEGDDPKAATIGINGDRSPYSIVYRDSDVLVLQGDHSEIVSGSTQDGSARYRYWRDTEGVLKVIHKFTRGKLKGEWNCPGLCIGYREEAYNPHV